MRSHPTERTTSTRAGTPGRGRGWVPGGRLAVAATVLALAASACAWVPTLRTHPGGPGAPVRIVAPADRSQAPADGTVPVELALSPRVRERTLRVWLRTGSSAHEPWAEITDRFAVGAADATATLTAADLQPGIAKLVVAAWPRHGHHLVLASTAFSWEPDVAPVAGCDVLDPAHCQLPFPSDAYTRPDPTSATGRRVDFDPAVLPANSAGVPFDPTEWNRNDGFSPGSPALVHVPGLDLERTGAAPITDIGRSLDADSPIVVIDADTGEHHLQWAELDANATTDATRALYLRPGVNYEEGHRYIVALRRLRDADGRLIPPSRAFRLYRDRIPTFDPAIEARRPHLEQVFAELHRAGVARDDLYVAWDFTVASASNLAGRMVHIRDDAFASLHGDAPGFTVDEVVDDVDAQIWRRVYGTFEVPLYLTGTGEPGSRFDYGGNTDPDALPVRNGTYTARFVCNIPRATTADGADPVTPARGVVYGHGLLGSYTETNSGSQRAMADESNMVYCGTDWIGMASEDLANVAGILTDLSRFPTLADRVQQGILDALFLGRLLKDPDGFASSPAFRAGASDTPVLVPGEVYYDGNSQGGIIGGAATAVSTEWTSAVLGVPGMNYSTLLRRSVDFDTYALLLNPSYPDELDRSIGLAAIQMLWDRAEANGYAAHMTDDPYPGTPAHRVLLHEAFGDHQVANVTTEVEARTIGAHLRVPALAPGRDPDVVPDFGIPPVPSYPFDGSALVVWDSGTPAPPTANLPPSGPEYGSDPHGRPRSQVSARAQKSEFLRPDGVLVDVCGGAPCLAP